ncbi:hypothetical protein RUM44_011826 [Polyplax serrata]|uniref:EI24 n=1 Tax=Polyplax serrata TaxID=468196 RepID=A0ABR1B9K3_POLSC
MDIFKSMSRGALDSVRGSLVIFYLDTGVREKSFNSGQQLVHANKRSASKSYVSDEEPKILKRTLQCCALNGGVFWASLLVFDVVLLPLLKILVGFTMGRDSSTGLVWFWIKMFLSWTFSAIWVLPLLLLSKVVNNLWFMDIADLAYRHTRGNIYVPRSVSYAVADTFFSIFVQILFLVQSVLVCLLPSPLGQVMWMIHICMLYSLYSFEYRWVNMGWELHRRLTYIETHWPYFIGFGLPLAFFTSLPNSYIVSGCVFSILFPLFIVSSNEADLDNEAPGYYPLQLFRPVVAIANSVLLKSRQTKRRNTALKSS